MCITIFCLFFTVEECDYKFKSKIDLSPELTVNLQTNKSVCMYMPMVFFRGNVLMLWERSARGFCRSETFCI